MSRITRNCEGTTRRDFLQLGLGTAFGLGMVDLMRLQSFAAPLAGKVDPAAVRCILLWLDGGPTQLETFDPKPEAPVRINGGKKAIKTSAPGVYYSEYVPRLAKIAHKCTIIRSVRHDDPNHGGGNHYMMTGLKSPLPTSCDSFISFHPSYGSVVSYMRGSETPLPAYMTLPRPTRSGGPHFLGPQHAPFAIGGDPYQPDFKVRDVVLPPDISQGRARTRRQLQTAIDRMHRNHDTAAEDPAVTFDKYYHKALDTVNSPQAQAAFDISREPDDIRDMYGRNELGQRLLLARRLVEAGVPFVTCYNGGWDHHGDIFKNLEGRANANPASDASIGPVDQGLTALVTDLDQRGMLDTTMILCFGEFGRSAVPQGTGRNHWPHAMSIFTAGAGIPGGHVVGATDEWGAYAAENIYGPEDFAASLYTKMGIDPHQHLHTADGRPVPLVKDARIIKELFA